MASAKTKRQCYLAACFGLVAVQVIAELAMGRPPICTCRYVKLWYGDLFGAGLSQHLIDWYSFTHITHGVVFYALLRFLFPRASLAARLFAMVVLEVSWEVLENTPFIIDRYRQSALAQGYNGDSVLNSVSDVLFAVMGFALAGILPVRWSVVIVLVSEGALALLIRDNLVLNIVQLVHPSEALSNWQASGGFVGSGRFFLGR